MKQRDISRRIFLKAALGTALAAGLAGCGDSALAGPVSGESSLDPASSAIDNLPVPEDCQANGYEGGDGHYMLLTNPHTGNSTLLYWFDYGTMQQAVLCNAPNCTHMDESCPAVLTGCYTDPFRYSEGLLWIATGPNTPNALWRMNLDGTGHTLIYTAPSNARILWILAACTQGAWFLLSIMDGDDPYEHHGELYYVDFAAGQSRSLCSFAGSMWPYGAQNGLLLMTETTEDTTALNAYDPSSGAPVRRLALVTAPVTRIDDMLYQMGNDGVLIGWPIDGSQDAPAVQCRLRLPEGMQPYKTDIVDVVEDHALLTIYDEGDVVKDGPVWSADLSTGQLTAMPATYLDKGQNEPPQLRAVTPAGLFGWVRVVPTTATHVFSDGTVETVEDRDVLWCLIDRKAAAFGEWKFKEFTPID